MNFNIGDRVAYTGAFLRATAAHELGARRGTVVEAGGVLVRVQWDGEPEYGSLISPGGAPVLAKNLVREDRIHLEAV